MKTLDILRTASSNLKRSKLRTFLTIIAIFIGALTLTLTNGIGAGVSSYIDKQLGNVGAENVLIVQQKQDEGISSDEPAKYETDQAAVSNVGNFSIALLSENDIEKIQSTEGVLSAEPQLWATPEYISAQNDEKYKAELSAYIEGLNVDLAAGATIESSTKEHHIILPVAYVKSLGYSNPDEAIGKQVTFGVKSSSGKIEQVEASIKGVQQKALLGDGMILASRTLVEHMRDIQTRGLPESTKNQHIAVIARFDSNADQSKIDALKQRLRDHGYRAMTIEDQIGVVKDIIGAITNVLNVFAGIALLAASFGIINTLLMAVQERTKEIGLMKAMGMSSAKIFMLFSAEAVLLGFWGSLLGVVVANIVGQVANRIAADSFLKDLPGFDLLAFPLTSMLMIIGIIMLVAFIAGTLPARRAAKQNPIDALRYE